MARLNISLILRNPLAVEQMQLQELMFSTRNRPITVGVREKAEGRRGRRI
jgi:hypothetical protein